jgi:hypothetical protein
MQALKNVQIPTSPFEAGFVERLQSIVLTVSEALETFRLSRVAT